VDRTAVDKDGGLVLFVSRQPTVTKQLAAWRDEILDLRRCVHLWDLLSSGDEPAVARHIRWQSAPVGGFSVHYDSHPHLKPGTSPSPPDQRETSLIVSTETDRELMECLKPGDVRVPAMLQIEAVVNQHLDGLVQPRLLSVPQQEALLLHLVPQNVLGGIWLQFAQAVAENKCYARCKECGAWFEVSLPGARKTRVYCSDGCKVKAYMERKDRAVQLSVEGWTVKEIAAELGTDKDTLKRWLGKKK
jgi:hypothetical protein